MRFSGSPALPPFPERISPPGCAGGRRRRGGAGGGGAPAGPCAFSESAYAFLQFGWSPLYSLREGSWKLVRTGSGDHLFDLAGDPGERHDLASRRPDLVARLGSTLERFHDSLPRAGELEGVRAELRGLGYLSGGGAGLEVPGPRESRAAGLADPGSRLEILGGIQGAESDADRGDPGGAVSGLRALLLRDPSNPALHFLLAEELQVLGRSRSGAKRIRLFEEALGSARKALALRPGDPRNRELAMKLLLLLGRYRECDKVAREVRAPSAGFYFLRANLRSLPGSPYLDLDGAIADLESALRMAPGMESARALLRELESRKGTRDDRHK